jgi:GDPmannose 4,6-dehydratase
MTTALISGAAGQDGVYLAHMLRDKGYRVVGLVAPGSESHARLWAYLDGVEIEVVDLRDRTALGEILYRTQPDEVYNLAAKSSVGTSWHETEDVAEINATAVHQLLDILLRYRDDTAHAPRFFQASSAEIFGAAQEQPQTAATPHAPRSPYGEAKSIAHNLTVNYRQAHGLFACNGILFNHESPLRSTRFVTRKITRAVAEIAVGRRQILTLGNLDARRDWGAAADYVEAMWLMLQQNVAADAVIATGVTTSIRDFVELAFSHVGIDDPWRHIESDPALMRPSDVRQLWGDPTATAAALGWSATTSLADLVAQMVTADIERLTSGVEESPELLGW